MGHHTVWIQSPEATSEAPLQVTVTETLKGSFCLLPAAYEMVRAQRADQQKISTKMTILKTVYLAAFAADHGALQFEFMPIEGRLYFMRRTAS